MAGGRARLGPVWPRLLALGFGLALALAFDQAVRLFLPADVTVEGRPWYLRTVQYHPVLGWSGYPDFAETNDGIRYQTNSRGYRDREPADVEGGTGLRVLFLGDSFTWGDEVGLEERFTSLLEASCGLHCDRLPPIHATNQGIIGYGTAQSLLQYVLTPEDDRSDVVILALFTGNDLSDNAVVDSPSGPRPRLIRCDAEWDSEDLCLEGVPVPPVVDWPAHRLVDPRGAIARTFGWSGLITLASRRRAPGFLLERRVAGHMKAVVTPVPFTRVDRTSDAAIEDRLGQLEAILGAMDRTVRGEGRAFGVLVFPSAGVYVGDAGDEHREYSEILGVLDRLDIPSADYLERTKDARMEALFFGRQDHWRPSGHQVAAELLRELLVAIRADGA